MKHEVICSTVLTKMVEPLLAVDIPIVKFPLFEVLIICDHEHLGPFFLGPNLSLISGNPLVSKATCGILSSDYTFYTKSIKFNF